ncbi:hypothetical protein PG996_014073 [Apiospora saccharicola]|uniref:Uncharacterized protein n=1 Tax=Apiospora saccharicola TaxID=335842 RepID=A0ABR1TJW4_9PEZI
MAPNKDKKTGGDKKIEYSGHGFTGELVRDGSKVRCLMPPLDGRREHCNAEIGNTYQNINSHVRTQHNKDSARYRDNQADPDNPWICPCDEKPRDSWSKYYTHLRNKHGLRGESKSIRQVGGPAKIDPKTNQVIRPGTEAAAKASKMGTKKGGEKKESVVKKEKVVKKEDVDESGDEQDDDDDGIDELISPLSSPGNAKKGPEREDDEDEDSDDGFGSSGAAGGLITAAA